MNRITSIAFLILSVAGVALARAYPIVGGELDVPDPTVVPRNEITIARCGFAPGTEVNVTVESDPIEPNDLTGRDSSVHPSEPSM